MKKTPLVSITIATKNEACNIGRLLKSIKKQTYPLKKIEIIVVDNNSTDQTKKIARQFTNKVYNYGPERSAQRNFGMLKKSQGQYLMFLDADMSLSTTTIKAAVDKIQSEKLVALYIPEIIPGNKWWNKVRNFERSFYDATVIDGLRFFKKSAFVKAGGFDEKLFAFEDWDLDKRIKKIGPVGLLKREKNQVLYHHEINFQLKKYLIKKSYYLSSVKLYWEKWGQNDPDIKKQFSFYYRFFGVFLEKNKWRRFFSHPLLFFCLYGLKICLGIKFLLLIKNDQ